jgi:phospholipid/cholesterol/gamma-HCH transport system ATP-binding protein
MNGAPPATDIPRISVRGLVKSFGPKLVLDRLDLDVAAGESLVVIGGSGSGKSVLLKCILGLMDPDEGSIRIDGVEITTMSRAEREVVRARFGMLFQAGALFDSLPVWQNVCFGLLQSGRISAREARAKAVEVLAQVGLADSVADLWPAELSGGMQKRVALARAIAAQPDILFFDEPTTGLDPIMGAVIDGLIVDCVKRLGATAVSITHDMASARRIADRVAMIFKGRIIWSGPASAIDDPGEPHVAQFVRGARDGPITMELRR